MSRGNVIVFAGALYDAPLWTNRQQIALRLADRGWKVLYVEPRLFLFRPLRGRFQGTGGRWRWLLRQFSPQRVRSNLWVQAQANLIPGARRAPFVGWLNHVLWNAWHVRLHAWELGIKDPVLLVYDTEAAEFLDDFPRSSVVYDCVDDHKAQAGVDRSATLVEQEEAAIASRADAIAVTTQPLFQRFSKIHHNVHLAPNAADVEAFLSSPQDEPSDVAKIPHPRIGTVGALDAYKLDVPMLMKIARQRSAWQFVLVGPVGYVGSRQEAKGERNAMSGPTACRLLPPALSVADLQGLPNVHFLGAKPRALVPAYVHAFDVAIIPYRESPYNHSSFPLKFWEFMASGKPVVASGLPSLGLYKSLIRLATSREEFEAGIAYALERGVEGREARIAEAKRHDWSGRVNLIEQLL